MADLGMRVHGKNMFLHEIERLESRVMASDAASEDGSTYIIFVSELGQRMYSPPEDKLKRALILAERKVNWEAESDKRIKRYEFLEETARKYGLEDEANVYANRISSIKHPEAQRKSFMETSGVYLRVCPDQLG